MTVENTAYILEDARINGKKGSWPSYNDYRIRLSELNISHTGLEQALKKLCEVLEL